MAVNKNFIGTINYSSITILILAVIILPIPSKIMDFLILINIALSAILLADVHFRKKENDYAPFAKYLLFMTIFGLAVNFMVTRQILSLGEYFGSVTIRFTAYPFANAGIKIIIASLAVFTASVIFVYFKFVRKIYVEITKSAELISDNRYARITEIDKELTAKSITENEADKRKMNIQKEIDFLESLSEAAGFLSNCEIFRFILIIINLLGGIFLGMNYRGELGFDAFIRYASFAISGGILTLIPVFFLAYSTRVVLLQKRGI